VAIKAVLFDYGGVILSSPFEAFAHYERDRGLPAGFLRSVNATNHHGNAWARLERNELSIAEFDEAFAAEAESLGHRVPGADVLALLAGEVRPAMVEAVRRCHEAFATALLTNNVVSVDVAAMAGTERAEVLDHFDVIIESSRVGVRKPEPRFYEIALNELAIEPHEAVFLDDLGINLKPARAMGMATIKVDDPHDALAQLESLLTIPLR
jgi:putative hydrolase of the HAD superfamily